MMKRFLPSLLFMAPLSLLGAGLSAPAAAGTPAAAPPSGPHPAVIAGSSEVAARSGRWPATDSILGAGAAGPYFLSRTGVVSFSEVVLINGVRQLPVLDYQLNPADSSLTFSHVVRTTDVVSVHYLYDASISHPTPRQTSVNPFNIQVAGTGASDVRMIGGYTAGDAGSAGQGFSSLGLAASQSIGKRATFGTQLLLAPGAQGGGTSSLGSQQAAIGFNGQVGLGGLRLGTSWVEAGSDFADAKTAGAPAGSTVENVTLAGTLAPRTTVDAALSNQKTGSVDKLDNHIKVGIAAPGGTIVLTRTENLTGTGSAASGATATTLGIQEKIHGASASIDAGVDEKTAAQGSSVHNDHLKVGITTSGGTVSVSHTDSLTGSGASASTNGTTTLNADNRLGSKAELKLSGEIVRLGGAKAADGKQDGTIGLSIAPAAGVSVALTESRASHTGAAETATHVVAVGVGSFVQAQASLSQTGAGAAGADAGKLSLKVNPSKAIGVTVDDQYHQDAKGVVDRLQSVGTTVKQGAALSLSANLTDKSARGVSDVRSDAVAVGYVPGKALSVNFNTTRTDSGAGGITGVRKTDVQLMPRSMVKLTGDLTEQYGGANSDSLAMTDRKVGAGVAIDPAKSLHLGAGYTEDLKSETVERDRSVDAHIAPSGFLQVDGRYVDRDSALKDLPETATVSVGFHPAKALSVDGAYTQNPQDAKGQIALSTQRSLAVHSNWGLLDLSGKYSQTEPDGVPGGGAPGGVAPILAREFDLGLNFSKSTSIISSFAASSAPAGPNDGLYQYKMGLTHRVGDIFSLSLTGQVNADSDGMSGFRDGLKSNSRAKVGFNARW